MATTRDSVLYDANYVKKYLSNNRTAQAIVQCIPFEFTTISVFATGDIYNLCVLPANCRVVGIQIGTVGGIGSTVVIVGDAGDTSRYISATLSLATAGLSTGTLSGKGQGYTPTADTIAFATLVTTTPTSGVVKGCFFIIPGY